MLILGTLCEAI